MPEHPLIDEERPEVHVTLFKDGPNETRLRLILPGDGWNFDEAKVAKQMSEGLSPAEIENGILLGDPDAWLAVLRVSFMRADVEYPARMIIGEDISALMKAFSDQMREAMKRRPPTSASPSESAEPIAPETTDDGEAPS